MGVDDRTPREERVGFASLSDELSSARERVTQPTRDSLSPRQVFVPVGLLQLSIVTEPGKRLFSPFKKNLCPHVAFSNLMSSTRTREYPKRRLCVNGGRIRRKRIPLSRKNPDTCHGASVVSSVQRRTDWVVSPTSAALSLLSASKLNQVIIPITEHLVWSILSVPVSFNRFTPRVINVKFPLQPHQKYYYIAHAVWITRLFIAQYSDERWLYRKFLTTSFYTFIFDSRKSNFWAWE